MRNKLPLPLLSLLFTLVLCHSLHLMSHACRTAFAQTSPKKNNALPYPNPCGWTGTLLLRHPCAVKPTRFWQLYDGLSEGSCYGMKSWRLSWLFGISELEDQLQNWSLYTDSASSGQNAGSNKLRLINQLTNLWHRDRLQGSLNFMISICLMLWLRQQWRSLSTRSQNSEKEQVSKSSELRIPTDSYEEDKIAYMIYKYFRAAGAYEAVQRDFRR